MRDILLKLMLIPPKIYETYNDLPFLFERKKLKKSCKIRMNMLLLNHELIIIIKSWKNICRVIKFNQKDWLKPYIAMNTELKQKEENNFEKDFFKLINNPVFGKTMKNVRKYKDIKLVVTERRRNYLVSESNYHTKNCFTENSFAIEIKKSNIKE